MADIDMPSWTRADHDARTDRLRPLADHLRVGHDVLPEERRYADTWLHIALLAEEWFAEHPVGTPMGGAGLTDAEHNEHGELAGRINWDRTVFTEEAVEHILAARQAVSETRGGSTHALTTYGGGNRNLLGRHACTCGALLPRVPRGPELNAAFTQHLSETRGGTS